MNTSENLPVASESPEMKTGSNTPRTSKKREPGTRTFPFRVVEYLYEWFRENSFSPDFLSGMWSHPIVGYLAALVFQVVIVLALLVLLHVYPSIGFPEGPLILVILLVTLGWGAGPGIIALLVGAALLIFVVLPSFFPLGIAQPGDAIALCLYLIVGLTISILASNTERSRRTSEQLRLRLNTIIEAIPDSIALYDMQGKRVQQNRAARQINPQENPPLSLAEMPDLLDIRSTSGEPLSLEALPLARALHGETVVFAEFVYRVPVKQQDRFVSVSAAPLFAPNGKTMEGAVTITHDLTERKQMEDALRASEERYRSIVQTANEGIWLIDGEARTLYVNERMAEMLGVRVAEMGRSSVFDFVFPEDETEGQRHIENNLRGNFEQFDFRFRRSNGSSLHTLACTSPTRDARGRIVGALGMFNDVTERKRGEEEEHLLAEISKVLASTLDYQDTIAGIAQAVVPRFADWFAIVLVDAEGHFELIELQSKDSERVQQARALRGRDVIDLDALSGAQQVVRTGDAELYPEVTEDMLVAAAKNKEGLAIARQLGFTSLMSVPLVARGKTIGVVTFVAAESGRKYDGRDLALAVEVGRRVGVALDNAQLYREVKQARDQFNIILRSVADGIIAYNRDGRIIYANEAAAELTGYALVQALMETSPLGTVARYETIDEKKQPFPRSQLPYKRVFAGEREAQATIGYRDTTTGQIERWSDVKSRPIFDENGEVLYAITIIHDITEQKAADETRQQLAAIVVSSADAIIGKTLDGVVTSWNEAAEKMYGYTAEEIVGKPITLLFPQDRQDEFITIMEHIRKGERIEHHETTRLTKDGKILTVSVTVSPIKDISGEIIGASAIARDISEQKRLQAQLRRSNQQLEVILGNIADGISVRDADGHIVFLNDAGAKLSGYDSATEMLSSPEFQTRSAGTLRRFDLRDEQGDPFPPEELPGFRALRGEKAPQAIVEFLDSVTQTRRWSRVKAQPIVDEKGQVQFSVSIFSDITESLEEQQRKDEFIRMASHELKTPVTSLKGFTQVLQRRLRKQADEQGLHYLDRIDAQLNKLTKLISDLLDISKIRAGKLTFRQEPFELDTLVQETVENMQAATITHQFLIEGRTGGCILGDRDRLGQVFINLLTNAEKYSPQSNRVLVRLSREQQEAIVSVQDYGIGIDETYHQKIFEHFYQVTEPEEKTFPGLGIGLSISHEIVERHHGRMWVESKKGEGATFFVALPMMPEG